MSAENKNTNGRDQILFDEKLYDYHAEAGVLSVFLLNEPVNKINEISEEYFFNPLNKIIYRYMLKMYNNSQQIDIISLIHLMKGDNKCDDRLMIQLNHVSDIAISSAAFDNHLAIIKKKYFARYLVNAFNRSFGQIKENMDINLVASNMMDTLLGLFKETTDGSIVDMSEACAMVLRMAEDIVSGKRYLIKTWFSDLDRLMGGITNGSLVVLGGRPGMGKSVFSMCLILNSIINGVPCGLVNYEMTTEDTMLRMLSNVARKPYTSLLRTVNIKDEEKCDELFQSLATTMDKITKLPLYQTDNPKGTLSDLKGGITKLVQIHGCRVIFVDYLQLIKSLGYENNRVGEIGDITRSLKLFAKEMDVVIVLMSQLHRGVETRADKHPVLSDLRESGSIEQDADVVMFLYRDEYYNVNSSKQGIMEVIVGKNRNGRVGTVELYYEEELSLVTSLSRESEQY